MIRAGDYVSFKRVVRPKVQAGARDASGKWHKYTVRGEEIERCVGAGIVLSVAKRGRVVGGRRFHTARVAAGPSLGTVTAVLDDATIIGVQQAMFEAESDLERSFMYDQGDHA